MVVERGVKNAEVIKLLRKAVEEGDEGVLKTGRSALTRSLVKAWRMKPVLGKGQFRVGLNNEKFFFRSTGAAEVLGAEC